MNLNLQISLSLPLLLFRHSSSLNRHRIRSLKQQHMKRIEKGGGNVSDYPAAGLIGPRKAVVLRFPRLA